MAIYTWKDQKAQRRYEGRIRCMMLGALPFEYLSSADIEQLLHDSTDEWYEELHQRIIDADEGEQVLSISAYEVCIGFCREYAEGNVGMMRGWLKSLAKKDREICHTLLELYQKREVAPTLPIWLTTIGESKTWVHGWITPTGFDADETKEFYEKQEEERAPQAWEEILP